MVEPLAKLGAAPLVHCSGDVFFNQILITWLLPMIVERSGGDPEAFAERTVKGELRYDSPEWIEAFATIANLRESGVMLEGSGATDYVAMQQVLLQGKAAATFQGTWMLAADPGGDAFARRSTCMSRRRRWSTAPPDLARSSRGPATAFRRRPPRSGGRVRLPGLCEPSGGRPGGDRRVAELLAHGRVERSDRRSARARVPAAVRRRDPAPGLALGTRDHRRDRQSGAGPGQGRPDPASAGSAIQTVADELRETGRSYYR